MDRVVRGVLIAVVMAQTLCAAAYPSLTGADLRMIDDLSHRSFIYFIEQTDPRTGLTLDRVPADAAGPRSGIASIAASGFALTAFCIGEKHHWIMRTEAERRATVTLSFLVRSAPRENGWFYHFMDSRTGVRTPHSELSSIDTAILLAGVLTARACFHDDAEIVSMATELFNSVNFPWMMNGSKQYFSLGWMPESGFLTPRWSAYSELLILYVLGIGSPTHPIPATAWDQWRLPLVSEKPYVYIGGGPLFIHQFPLAWIDLRYRRPIPTAGATPLTLHLDYFRNAVIATEAQREGFRDKLARRFPGYSANVWGLTSSDSTSGYIDWGASLDDTRIDGTVAPSAAAGSLMLAPGICIPAVETMIRLYGKKIYGRYGFVDAFNPTSGWVGKDVVGIAAGIALLSAENLRDGSVWGWFMSNPEPQRALDMVGLVDMRHPFAHYKINPDIDSQYWTRR